MIVLWHVLEHLDDPELGLRRAVEALGCRGRIVISVPNLGSLQARIGGRCWFHLDVPRHAVHFTRRGLVRLIGRCGLEGDAVSATSSSTRTFSALPRHS